MAAIASQYRTDVILFTPPNTGQQLVLPKDPKRFFVQFQPFGVNPYFLPVPSGQIADLSSAPAETMVRTYKFHDCPGVVTGEWYVNPTSKVWSVVIITDTYIGD